MTRVSGVFQAMVTWVAGWILTAASTDCWFCSSIG